MGFVFSPIWPWGSAWWSFGLLELRYENMFLNEEAVWNTNLCDGGFLVLWKATEKWKLELVKTTAELGNVIEQIWIRKLQVASKKLPILSILRYSRVAIKKNIWFDFKALEGASNTSPELRRNWHYERVLSNLNRQSLLYFIPFCFYLCQNFCFGFRDAVKKCFTSCMA